ncbi:MAG: cell division ATP-binding protein FtsE [Clostridiales bacterium]|nr:cell division ATP-binding protein FtsE [Clostridiales bacterium]
MARRRLPYDTPAGNVITMRDVHKSYAKNTDALNGVTIDIKDGEFVFIVGDSGSGKSTLIKLLLHELTPTTGDINVLGYDMVTLPHRKIAKFRRNLGIVFQDFRLLKDRTVYDNVVFAERIIQTPTKSIKKDVPRMLDIVGLGDKYKSRPQELSGGEQQRVALARAIINHPFILLADEPTGNLDPRNSWEIMQLLECVNKEGTTVVVVTHNREIVNAMHKRVITMKQGVIISDEEHGGYTEEENEDYEEGDYSEDSDYPEESAGTDGYAEEESYDEPDNKDGYPEEYKYDFSLEDDIGSGVEAGQAQGMESDAEVRVDYIDDVDAEKTDETPGATSEKARLQDTLSETEEMFFDLDDEHDGDNR